MALILMTPINSHPYSCNHNLGGQPGLPLYTHYKPMEGHDMADSRLQQLVDPCCDPGTFLGDLGDFIFVQQPYTIAHV